MNILVTGGLGLIGHNVVKRLQDQGHVVSIMDTQTNYGIIPQPEIDYLVEERIKKIDLSGYYKYDICKSHVFISEPAICWNVCDDSVNQYNTDKHHNHLENNFRQKFNGRTFWICFRRKTPN